MTLGPLQKLTFGFFLSWLSPAQLAACEEVLGGDGGHCGGADQLAVVQPADLNPPRTLTIFHPTMLFKPGPYEQKYSRRSSSFVDYSCKINQYWIWRPSVREINYNFVQWTRGTSGRGRSWLSKNRANRSVLDLPSVCFCRLTSEKRSSERLYA